MTNDFRQHAYLILTLSFVGYIALGIPDALVGVAWPSMRTDFKLPLGALGALYVATTVGYVIASSATGAILSRIGIGTLLAASCALTGLSLLGYTLAPVWIMLLVLGVFAGFGGGAIDAAINTHAANHFSTRLINVLHAFYGIGAALGPALMTAILVAGHNWRNGYWIVVAVEIALAIAFAVTRKQWPPPIMHHSEHRPARLLDTLRLGRVQVSLLVFLIYTGCEAAAGAWVFSLLYEARGVATTSAGTAVTLYWCGLFASRLGYAFLPKRTQPAGVIGWSIVTALVGMGCVVLNLNAIVNVAAISLVGLASGPIFPCMIAMTPARFGRRHTANAVGAQVSGAAVGLAVLPALCGLAAQRYGLESIPILLTVCWAIVLVAYFALQKCAFGDEEARSRQASST